MNTDFEDWLFTFEIEDSKSHWKIKIEVDRKAFTDSLIWQRSQFENNCTITISDKLWKQKEQKIIWINLLFDIEKSIEEYLNTTWLKKLWWVWYYTNRQDGIRTKDGIKEIEICLYRYV